MQEVIAVDPGEFVLVPLSCVELSDRNAERFRQKLSEGDVREHHISVSGQRVQGIVVWRSAGFAVDGLTEEALAVDFEQPSGP